MRKPLKVNEEQQTVIWFLWVFYIILLFYDFIYYFFLRAESGLPTDGLGYWLHLIMIALLPVALILLKRDRPEVIKYLYFITFSLLTMLNDVILYLGTNIPYSSGNVVEIIIVLFSPIFVNKRFFLLVTFGTIVKLAVIGLILTDPAVMLPILIVIVFALIAYILLNRFFSYVDAVKSTYDRQLEGIVKGIIATLELKDVYTRGHSERVAEYARLLAKETSQFKQDALNSFYYVCLLHDIGKIQIPDSILTKPGKLTTDEFEVIKTHPVVGAEAVKHVDGVAQHIDVVRHHHERWDGTGYPDRLREEEIPLLARITAVADAFDAMTSSRSYRAALPTEIAYQRIIEGSGTQFDPKLVRLFQKVYPAWCSYHKNYSIEKRSLAETAASDERGDTNEGS